MADIKVEKNDKKEDSKETKLAKRDDSMPSWIRELDSWIDDFRNNFFDQLFVPFGDIMVPSIPFTRMPAMDIEETDTEYKIHAELPGLNKDDVTVTLEDGRLKISADKKIEDEKKDKHFVRKERRYESFYREIRVPKDADTSESIDAKLEDGMLNITLKRKPEEKKEKKEVKVE
nr:Hsp20/alpha crystallin family protein [Candidatus Sigynarchaeota archaeon]